MLAVLNGINAATGLGRTTTPEPRLTRAAHEFEAQLMQELLRPLARTGSMAGDGEEDAGGEGTLGEFAAESLAGALSAGGGFGIAGRILDEFSHSGHRPVPAQGSGNVAANIEGTRRTND